MLVRSDEKYLFHLFIHISTLEEPLDSSHFLDDLGELGVLFEQLLHLPLLHARPVGHSLHPIWFLTESISDLGWSSFHQLS